MYEGKLKKKYSAWDAISAIQAFAAAQGLSVEVQGSCAVPVFNFLHEGIRFCFEDMALRPLIVKHETAENSNYMLAYEILYHIKPYFSRFEVQDDYSIWANFVYNKRPTRIPLRTLTQEEQIWLELIQCEGSGDSFQVLYGLIYLFVKDFETPNPHKMATYHPLNWFGVAEKCWLHDFRPIWSTSVITFWMYACMAYKNKGPVRDILGPVCPNLFAIQEHATPSQKRMYDEMLDIAWGIVTCIVGFYGGTTGRKMVDILHFFEHEEGNFNRQEGKSLCKDPVLMLRFVLSCFDFFGYRITAKPFPCGEKLQVDHILYQDMFRPGPHP